MASLFKGSTSFPSVPTHCLNRSVLKHHTVICRKWLSYKVRVTCVMRVAVALAITSSTLSFLEPSGTSLISWLRSSSLSLSLPGCCVKRWCMVVYCCAQWCKRGVSNDKAAILTNIIIVAIIRVVIHGIATICNLTLRNFDFKVDRVRIGGHAGRPPESNLSPCNEQHLACQPGCLFGLCFIFYHVSMGKWNIRVKNLHKPTYCWSSLG